MSFSDDGATRVVRTDGFGGYRWGGDAWRLNVSSESLPGADVEPGLGGGVLAVAIAPSDGTRAYMAFNHKVFRSDDGARTWSRVLSDVSTAPNDDFRTTGPRLTVDPVDPDVVYYGTQLDGLIISTDGGVSWTRVSADVVPHGDLVDLGDSALRGDLIRPTNVLTGNDLAGGGVNSIAVDRSGPVVDGRSQVVYAASHGDGVFRSGDAGNSWKRISPPEVSQVGYLRVLGNRDVVLTAHADPTNLKGPAVVWRYRDGSWSSITPATGDNARQNWRGVAADPNRAGQLAVMAPGGRMALSQDYGSTWQVLSRRQDSTGDVPWLSWALNEGTDYMSLGEIVFDPVKTGRVWFTEGTGVWFADVQAGDTTVTWRSQSRGIEQLVPTGVVSPPGGRPVMTAWDRPIFRSEDLDSFPEHYGPVNEFSSAWSVEYSPSDPDYLVASVASHKPPYNPSRSGYSSDGGRSWTPFPRIPQASTNAMTTFGFGSMAVSEPGNVVWVPAHGKRPEYTTDGGNTWQQVTLPGVMDYATVNKRAYFVNRRVVTADQNRPGTFYLYVLGAGIFRSTDGARSWIRMADNAAFKNADWGWNVDLESVPGSPGELYMSPGRLAGTTSQPLLHSTDAGATWTKVAGVSGVTAYGFGAASPDSGHSVIYLAGYLDGRYGIYRSTDATATWTYLTDYPAGRTPDVIAIDGDKDTFGRFYLAVGGSSFMYGELTPAPSLTAEVVAPQSVRSAEMFQARVLTTGGSSLSYRWSMSGPWTNCRVMTPAARDTKVKCSSKVPATRTLSVVVEDVGGDSTAASTDIRVIPATVATGWSRPELAPASLRAVASTGDGQGLSRRAVELEARWPEARAWRSVDRSKTGTAGVVRFSMNNRRPGWFRLAVRDQPGLADAHSRPRFVR